MNRETALRVLIKNGNKLLKGQYDIGKSVILTIPDELELGNAIATIERELPPELPLDDSRQVKLKIFED